MTLLQVLKRIELIATSHKMVRNYKAGLVQDFLTDSRTKYPSVFLQNNNGSIGLKSAKISFNYTLFFLDLVNVLGNEKNNEADVQSDMVSIAQDILTQMNNPNYDDWRISSENNFRLVVEEDNDMLAGCVIDITIDVPNAQNTCDVPSTLIITPSENETDVKVYDLIYTAAGNENNNLVIPELSGKKIIFASRENSVLYKVSNNPESTEYTFDGINVGLGFDAGVNERFLFLYRNN